MVDVDDVLLGPMKCFFSGSFNGGIWGCNVVGEKRTSVKKRERWGEGICRIRCWHYVMNGKLN